MFPEVVRIYNMLVEHKYEIPITVRLDIGVLYAKSMLDQKAFATWARNFDMSAGEEAAEWDINAPNIASLLPEVVGDADVLKLFLESLEAIVFNDQILSLLMRLKADEAKDAAIFDIRKLCKYILDELSKSILNESFSDNLKEASDNFQRWGKGLLTLISPEPGRYDATDDDVAFLGGALGKKKVGKTAQAAPAMCDVWVLSIPMRELFRESGAAWAALFQECSDYLSPSLVNLPAFEKVSNDIETLASTEDEVERQNLAASVFKEIPSLRSDLPPGATVALEIKPTAILKDMVHRIKSGPDSADKIKKVLCIARVGRGLEGPRCQRTSGRPRFLVGCSEAAIQQRQLDHRFAVQLHYRCRCQDVGEHFEGFQFEAR